MITEDYVSFETAKLLKEKGFDEYTISYYDKNEKRGLMNTLLATMTKTGRLVLVKWTREFPMDINAQLFKWR